ncbi:imidazoleglycerol-phosphate dehydratase [Streptomyces violaceusniger]|uniref:Imidazoleglycerol-phosphate dehydratase n=1 Tax=Streptomyces violaceusniger TaxID=68280 RepID=A0A4D4KV54_STRVO|nr:imidazoleglycerol-phosphate dehydratase [Streptomyces violaceusniger]
MTRVGRVERTTKETSVVVEIDLDGTGQVDVSTGVGFYDHMLDQLGRHGLFDLTVKTEGDLHIDTHHTIEDTALALGAAFKQALGDKVGIYRFGNCTVPLDESLAQVTVDLSGRPYLVHTEPENIAPMIGTYDTTMTRHILESFVAQAQIALHVHVPYGRNAHHIVECQFKALARALRYASERDPAPPGSSPPRRGPLTVSVARAAAGPQTTLDPRFRRAGGEANEVAVSVARAAAGPQTTLDPRFRRAGGEANEVAA